MPKAIGTDRNGVGLQGEIDSSIDPLASAYFDVKWEDCGCSGKNCCYKPIIYWKGTTYVETLGQLHLPFYDRKDFLVFFALIDGRKNLDEEAGFSTVIGGSLVHVPYPSLPITSWTQSVA